METLKCGMYVARQVVYGRDSSFVVSVDTLGNQTWLKLNPRMQDALYQYKPSDNKPSGYTMIRISEALQEVFCASPH